MVQEYTVLLWCDIHYVLEDGAKITGRTISLFDKELEICPHCENRYTVGDMEGIVEKVGRKNEGNRTIKPSLDATHQTKEALFCPFDSRCNKGKPYKSSPRLKTHMMKAHPDGATL